MAVRELIGVYDADATLWGEVSYWVGARLGQRHCSLCDIMHRSGFGFIGAKVPCTLYRFWFAH